MLLATAWRNLWRNRRRTQLTLSAMVVSSSLLMLALGVFSGMMDDMLTSATRQYHGHIVISKTGYQVERDLYATFVPRQVLKRLKSDPALLGAAPRLRGFALASGTSDSRPVELLGIEPDAEAGVTTLLSKGIDETTLPMISGPQALIGRGLARRLNLGIGDKLVVFTQAADGSLANDLLSVAGIFATGDSRQDNGLVLCPLPWLQQFLVLPDQVHEIALNIRTPIAAEQVADRLAAHLPAGLEAVDWGQLLPEMREAIASFDVSRMIIVAILYAATALGILNTLFMSVLERTREFGVLAALGLRPNRIRLLILYEAGLLGFIGLGLGTVLGLALTGLMATIGIDLSGTLTPITYGGGTILPRLHARFDPENILIPALALLAVSLLAALLPARRAARLKPVEALRHD
ncbi:MAG: ABC transporter permease [Geothermobacteraceae bacterium]